MQQDTFTSTIEHFAAEEEEIRAAAAFAAGRYS
jgi:cullin-associated NEDD8-dissociated protein 1